MRKLALVLCVLSVAGLLLTQVTPVSAAGKTHNMTATIVSIDVEAKTVTIKDDKGESKTAPVMGKAVESLKTLKAGDMVTLTCQDNEKGEHEGVTAIKVAKAPKA